MHQKKIIHKTKAEAPFKYWPKTYCPPSSPDLNPLDYSIWAMKDNVQGVCHQNVDFLKAKIAEIMGGDGEE